MMGEEFSPEPDVEWMLQVIQTRERQKEEKRKGKKVQEEKERCSAEGMRT